MPKQDQGINQSRYKVIPRTLIFLFKGEDVLLIKGRNSKSIWPNVYNGIGGHIEQGENVIQSAKRELVEETGLVDQSLWICGTILIDTGDKDTGILIFVLKGEYHGGKLVDSDEGTLSWVNINQLENLPVVEDLPVVLPLVYKHCLNESVFSGGYQYNKSGNLMIEVYGSPEVGSGFRS